MPTNDIWQSIEADLVQLSADSALDPLAASVEKLRYWASARADRPEVYQEFIAFFRWISAQRRSGHPLRDLVNQPIADNRPFFQPDMDVQSLYQSQGHIFQFILGDIRNSVQPPDPGIEINIVLLVMNSFEAESLDTGEAFRGYSDDARADFEDLRELLAKKSLAGWVQKYGARATDWRPFQDNDETIESLVPRILGEIVEYKKQLIPRFYTIQEISENRSKLRQLRTDGCVVVMDTISMHHPSIQRHFRRSLLDAYPSTLVARVAPHYDILQLEQQMLFFAEKSIEMEFFKRFRLDYDAKCVEASTVADFYRWMKDKVPMLIPEDEKAQPGIRKFMYKQSAQ